MDTERTHILVVDDLAEMAESTAELLTLWGYDVTACYSGAIALACARVRRPAAVLLDLVMPRMDGFEFAVAFRALDGCSAVPLIALSGYPFPGYEARAREAGIDLYLLKPAVPVRLRALLVAVTGTRSLPPVVGLRSGEYRAGLASGNPLRPVSCSWNRSWPVASTAGFREAPRKG